MGGIFSWLVGAFSLAGGGFLLGERSFSLGALGFFPLFSFLPAVGSLVSYQAVCRVFGVRMMAGG